MVEAEGVVRLVEKTKLRLDVLLDEYVELYGLAYESEAETRTEEEFAKSSLVPIWKELHRIIKAAFPDLGSPSES
jgi:hypothetical protein